MLFLTSTIKSFWKTREIHKNKSPFKYFNYVTIGQKKFDKQKKNHFKRTFENKFQF
jgi:hypothetical protein